MSDPGLVDTIAACVTAAATAALAVGAWIQLPLLGKQVKELATQIDQSTKSEKAAETRSREWHTMEVIQRYDFDPVIDKATSAIFKASKQGTDYSGEIDKRDIICIMNYFDGICIGIRQGFYIEEIVKEHMSEIFDHSVRNFVTPGKIQSTHYQNFMAVHSDWFPRPAPPPPAYKRSEV